MKISVLTELRRKTSQGILIILAVLLLAGWLAFTSGATQALAGANLQQPTVSIATVTGTPSAPLITVPQDQLMIKVHTGPGSDYPVVGILVSGEKAPALGLSPDSEWVKIVYRGVPDDVGWVYVRLVTFDKDSSLPVAEVPPTPTAKVTATLDPTMAARFGVSLGPTTAPTFTPPPALAVPTFPPSESQSAASRLPFGFIIIGLAVVGAFGVMLSFLRGR